MSEEDKDMVVFLRPKKRLPGSEEDKDMVSSSGRSRHGLVSLPRGLGKGKKKKWPFVHGEILAEDRRDNRVEIGYLFWSEVTEWKWLPPPVGLKQWLSVTS